MSQWDKHPGYPVNENSGVVEELREINKNLRELAHILRGNKTQDNVSGGKMTRTGDVMNPIQPGNTVKFLVTPSFTTTAFTLDGTKAAVTSSDTTNFPVTLDLTTDPTGATFEAIIPADAKPVGDNEAITVTWTYTNLDGTVATVTGTVTEVGIVDDVTGGTFAQIA